MVCIYLCFALLFNYHTVPVLLVVWHSRNALVSTGWVQAGKQSQHLVSHPPLTSNRHHLSYDDCLENKGRLQDCSCSIGSYHCIQCYAHIL